jgi:hypothetical protein
MNDPAERRQADPRWGLCAACVHARPITSDRGSLFVRCALAATDPRFPKYPPIPVIRCPGFTPDAVDEPLK